MDLIDCFMSNVPGNASVRIAVSETSDTLRLLTDTFLACVTYFEKIEGGF
jgi:hypothetical protein